MVTSPHQTNENYSQLESAFQLEPDLITGPAAMEAGIGLVSKPTGREALNLLQEKSLPRLWELLRERLPAGLLP